MKIIKLSPASRQSSQHLLTPWLTTDEAAAYCGLSRNTFARLQKEYLPCPATGGDCHNRRYFSPIVQEWFTKIQKMTDR